MALQRQQLLIVGNMPFQRPLTMQDLEQEKLTLGAIPCLRDPDSGVIFLPNADGVFDNIPDSTLILDIVREAPVTKETLVPSMLSGLASGVSSVVSGVGAVLSPVLAQASASLPVAAEQIVRFGVGGRARELEQLMQVQRCYTIVIGPPLPESLELDASSGAPKYAPRPEHSESAFWLSRLESTLCDGARKAGLTEAMRLILAYRADRAGRLWGYGQGYPDDPISLTLFETQDALVALAASGGSADAIGARAEYLERLVEREVFPPGRWGTITMASTLSAVARALRATLRETPR
eukprot:Amastigsp_a192080_4.p1 type:complete len:294 gc:universal Amastigsp_a192080_4:50-931(+)